MRRSNPYLTSLYLTRPERSTGSITDKAHFEEIEQWRRERYENLEKPDGWLSLVGLFWLEEGFGDTSNGKQTYGGGRFLYAPEAGEAGNVVLDFNKAYNPPCAFTAYAACPLPPRQNRLELAVFAGEKKYSGGVEH